MPEEKKYRAKVIEGHNDLMAAIEGLEEANFYALALFEDSDWTVADVLGHIVTWQEAMLDALDCLVAGRDPFIFSQAMRVGVDAFNAHKVAANKGRPLGSIMIELGQRYREVLRILSLFSLEELETPGFWSWLGKENALIQLIADNDWGHKQEHAEHIRAWRRKHKLGEPSAGRPRVKDLAGEFSLALVRYETEHRRFVNLAVALPPEARQAQHADEASPCNDWSCKEVVLYLTAWTEEALKGFETGQLADLERDRDAFNQEVVAAHADMSWADALVALQDAHARLVAIADALPPKAIEEEPRYLTWIDGLSADLALHSSQLSAWRDTSGGGLT